MPVEFPLLPLIGFVIAASVTPGPNNVLVAANAAQNGLRAAVPHIMGISLGASLMMMLVGLGLAGVLVQFPLLAQVMRWAAMAWLLYLAWGIATAPLPGEIGKPGFRFGFVQAMLFQWINPKAWLLALSIASTWVSPARPVLPQLLIICTVFFLACAPCCLPWALLGTGAARFLGSPARLRWFNVAMAVLLVVSMVPVALGE